MRGTSRRTGDPVNVSLESFQWPHAAIATLRHPTLPWYDAFAPRLFISASPLTELKSAGPRDRLSLLGQFAAHAGFLQFAGIADAEFDPDAWVVLRRRGADCRLIRIAARRPDPDASPSPLHNLLKFADCIGAPALDTLKQSWTRAESVFAEVHRRIREDAAADIRWLRKCAAGEIVPPGAEALEAICASGGPHEITTIDEVAAFNAYAALDASLQVVAIGTEFPIQPFAALATIDPSLPGSSQTPAAVADLLLDRLAGRRYVVIVSGNLDEQSRRVVDIFRRDRAAVASVRRWFVLSTRLAAQRAMEERLRRAADPRRAAEELVSGDSYDALLNDGTLPVDDSAFAQTAEPRRSYIAALALLGVRTPRTLASEFLRQFLFEQPLEELAVAGVTELDDNSFAFVSEDMREYCSRHVPVSSRPALCRAAAAVAELPRAGLLLIDAGDTAAGIERLQSFGWSDAAETITVLGPLPRSTLTRFLAARLGHALVDEGRYSDARALSPALNDDEREFLLGRCDRRTGDYATALARIARIETPAFDAQLLRAELLRLTSRLDEARSALAAIHPSNAAQTARLAFERAVLALDCDEPPEAMPEDGYLTWRLATYCALCDGDFNAAAEAAARSFEAARCAAERIDASLDRVFASFSSGRWGDTRAIALESLALVDESQGDRAAAGILFTLTFVEADDGRWTAAAEHIQRLRTFYASDPQRLAEIDLLSGYLEFTRCHFNEAHRLALSLLARPGAMPQIREAAALIADEVDWIEKRSVPLRSSGSRNRELDERYRLMRLRRRLPTDVPLTGFNAELARWHTSPRSKPPQAATRSQKLKLFRAAAGAGRDAVALAIADDLAIPVPTVVPPRSPADIEMLRLAATADYPFRSDLFSTAWCHATRNRLGQWSQEGSRPVDTATLDAQALSLDVDWLRCNERELLFIDGCSSWPESSREAIAALFRTRAENHRLHRVLEQEEQQTASQREAADGVVGESPAMRAVFALIDRIAQRDVAVCILGESGTGKELAGRAIHRASSRKHKPFTAINCAALPENLIESELFGHVRGAFTGADRDRAGLIETSDGGTLFLDEIGEMPLPAQAKLLRFLQDGEFRRVGDVANRSADVRIVSATNRKLEAAVEEGRFREDLYYRIRGVEIVLPPLRDRGDDVLLLARHFLGRERARHKTGPQSFTSEVEALLRSYNWPGNVRELQNTVRAAHALAGDARAIDLEHLPERLRKVIPARVTAGSYQDAVARFRRDLIEKSLIAASGNQNQAAALLKISRQALAYQIRELGIMVTKTQPQQRV